MTSDSWRFGPVSVPNFVAACECLYQSVLEPERSRQVREMAAALLTGELPSRYFFTAVNKDGSIAGVLWAMPTRSKSAYVWPPVVAPGVNENACAAALLREAGKIFDADRLVFSQCLLGQSLLPAEVFSAGGFHHVTQLRLLSAPAAVVCAHRTETDVVRVMCYMPDARPRFAAAISRTFIGSTDCEVLNKDRTGEELLAEYEPPAGEEAKHWRLYQSESGEDVGVVLMQSESSLTDRASSGAAKIVEIGYLGVDPEHRGRGLGRSIAVDAVRAVASSGETRVRVHVDSVNHYAVAIYESLGFRDEDSGVIRIRRRFGA